MVWLAVVVSILTLPLAGIRIYGLVATSRALANAPDAVRPPLRSRVRMFAAQVVQKLALIEMLFAAVLHENVDFHYTPFLAGVVIFVMTMAWTIAESFVHARALRKLDDGSLAYLQSLRWR